MKKSYLILIIIAAIVLLALIVASLRKGESKKPAAAPAAQETVDTEAPRAIALKWRDAILAGNLGVANSFSTKSWEPTNKQFIGVCKDNATFAKGFATANFDDEI